MPRKNQLLRYLKLDRLGRLTYTRQIPPALRPFLGGKATIRRTLGVDSSDCSNPVVLSAYAVVHGEIDGLITQAKAGAEKDAALFAGQSTAITAPDAQHPLSVREIAGIAGLGHQAVCGLKLLTLLADLQNKVSDVVVETEVFIRQDFHDSILDRTLFSNEHLNSVTLVAPDESTERTLGLDELIFNLATLRCRPVGLTCSVGEAFVVSRVVVAAKAQ